MKYFINGEIYLKKGPEVYDTSKILSEINEKIDELGFELSKDNPDLSLADELEFCEKSKERFQELDGGLNHSGIRDFWRAFNTRNGILLSSVDSKNADKVYKSLDEVEKDFVKLFDFLDKATFVGRKFRRTKSVCSLNNDDDQSYMFVNDNRYYIVLYAMQDLFLVLEHSFLWDEYIIIDSMYTMDGNYEFYGEVFAQYADKDMVYGEILEQVERNTKKL